MGLFGSTKIYVSSVLYNMAGDPLKRPNFLKTAVVGQVILPTTQSMGETLQQNYRKGPGLRLRSFFRWALLHYTEIGVPEGTLGGANRIDRSVVGAFITPDTGMTVSVQLAEVGAADYSYWADQYMFQNFPLLVDTAWTSNISETTGDITITLADASTHTFTPVGFDKSKAYIYATYSQTKASSSEAPVVGPTITLTPEQDFPDTTGYAVVSDTTTSEGPNNRHTVVYQRTVYMGKDPDPNVDQVYSTKTTITESTLLSPANDVISRRKQTTTQKIVGTYLSPLKIFIYQIGSGNETLDGLAFSEIHDGEYLPFIPIRLNNKFLKDTSYPGLYDLAAKAYKKATGGADFAKLEKTVKDNEHLADIDYGYVMYGAALNMLDNAGREYIYRFFDKCLSQQMGTSAEYLAAKAERASYENFSEDYAVWDTNQSIPGSPRYNTMRPAIPGLGTVATNSIKIKSNGTTLVPTNVDMKITWDLITKFTGTGLKKPGAKAGEYWLTKGPESTLNPNVVLITGRGSDTTLVPRSNFDNVIVINHQIDATHWESLQVAGAKHINNIYQNKSVDITAVEALDDAEESGFLIPLHYATMTEMSLKNSTQLGSACGYVVFNCYKIVKTGFFGSLFFQILIFVAIVALTVVFPPAAGLTGVLGSAAAVGAAVGLSGTIGLLVGAAINALAALIIMKVVALGAVLIFGEKLGAIIGTIVGLVALQVGTAFSNGMSFGDILHSLTKADNLISITSSVGNGFSKFIVAGANETVQKTQDLLKDYQKKSKEFMDQYVKDFGFGTGTLDPLLLTDAYKDFVLESSESFLDRTLLTGSDIAKLSMDFIDNFADYSIKINPALK